MLEGSVPDNPKLEDAVVDNAVLDDAIAGDRIGDEAILDDGILGNSLCAGDYGINVVVVPLQMLWKSYPSAHLQPTILVTHTSSPRSRPQSFRCEAGMVLLLPLLLAIACFSTAFALERPSKGNKCIFAKIKTQTKTKKGEAVWITKEDRDTSQRDCNEFCAKVNFNATGKATNNVRSATCFKNDGKTSPYVDDKGKNKSVK